jgi:hypothetical protein
MGISPSHLSLKFASPGMMTYDTAHFIVWIVKPGPTTYPARLSCPFFLQGVCQTTSMDGGIMGRSPPALCVLLQVSWTHWCQPYSRCDG